METGLALVAPGLIGLSAFVLLVPSKRSSTSFYSLGEGGWRLCVARQLDRLGSCALVAHLTEVDDCACVAAELRSRVAKFGLVLSSEGSYGLVAMCVASAGLAGALLSASIAGALVSVVACVGAVPVLATSARRSRQRALYEAMPAVFRTLATALGSGKTLAQAIEYVGIHESGRAGQEFASCALRLSCGESVEEALNTLSERLDAPGMGLLISALEVSQRTGSALEGLLTRSARMVEEQSELERLLGVKTAQARLSARIVCAMPALMVLLLSLVSQDFQRGLLTLQGVVCVSVAMAMDAAAMLIIRRLMKGVL